MRIVKFIIGALFIIAALGMFAQKEILAGLISVVLGAIILPPVSEKIKEKFQQWNSKVIRYISYAVLLVIISISTNKTKFSELSQNSSVIKIEEKQKPTASETGKSGVYNANGEKVGTIENKVEVETMDNSDFWENYNPNVKVRIHELIKNKDCPGLQKEFDNAHNNNQAQKNRTGRNNAELLDFIDNAMYKLGCYN